MYTRENIEDFISWVGLKGTAEAKRIEDRLSEVGMSPVRFYPDESLHVVLGDLSRVGQFRAMRVSRGLRVGK